ncbi:GntR family transcriptional regulator [Cohnella zeiphila]|uniref:GntR family transcriptional regulator n=1 Tax=Cohnella zeiphila TaxID=2761120 RepID=A0A7X0SP42_9BACL|nr:GntR family transcriptional regulator [Cohnella zeiphila]MBB6733588.1 GntR family transcriptional regulator [Cohnella zeiphila]
MGTSDGWTEIVFNGRDPVYLQVIRHFKERIATGRLLPGQTIPSRREAAAALKINPNTAQRAYKEMEEQRLIVTEGNSPSRITQDAEVLRSIRSELVGSAVGALIAAIRNLDVPVEELLAHVRREYEASRASKETGTEEEAP